MAKLNQVIALEKSAKAAYQNAITAAYHAVQKTDPFAGIRKVYKPKDDEGEDLPGENQKVVAHVPNIVEEFTAAMVALTDLTATKVEANTKATADVVLDGKVIIKKAPVELLLFLEKRLIDCATFVNKLPTLDPSFDWHWDAAASCWASNTRISNRSKKVPRSFTKAKATDKHAEQAEIIMEDVTVGTWETTNLSGAIPFDTQREYARRIVALTSAVKVARESANLIDVDKVEVGKAVFNGLFAKS